MKVIKCANNHLFDADRFSICPYCNGCSVSQDIPDPTYGKKQDSMDQLFTGVKLDKRPEAVDGHADRNPEQEKADFLGEWRIGLKLGGNFGTVYELFKHDGHGNLQKSVLKFIHIPLDRELKWQMEKQSDPEAVQNYFSYRIKRYKEEIRMLQLCKGNPNIVEYQDHLIVENPGSEGIGWDIMIRMELLYPIVGNNGYFRNPGATQLDVIRMWLEIANALVFLEQKNIIYRKLKPTNIMVSETGTFKLSDFGWAKEGKTGSARLGAEQYMTPEDYHGAEHYMAPEDYLGKEYDKRVDYYSLGMVIYYYLNSYRRPFMPPYPERLTFQMLCDAEAQRLAGEQVPKIPYVSQKVNKVLLKSIAFNPEERYQSAVELYRDIQDLIFTEQEELQRNWLDPDKLIPQFSMFQKNEKKKKRKRKIKLIFLLGILAAAFTGLIWRSYKWDNKDKFLEKKRARAVVFSEDLASKEYAYTDAALVLPVITVTMVDKDRPYSGNRYLNGIVCLASSDEGEENWVYFDANVYRTYIDGSTSYDGLFDHFETKYFDPPVRLYGNPKTAEKISEGLEAEIKSAASELNRERVSVLLSVEQVEVMQTTEE